MRTIVLEREAVLEQAADEIESFLRKKPDAVITMAAGRTMLPLWELLGERVRKGNLSFSEVSYFQTAEFIGTPGGKSLRRLTEEKLLPAVGLNPERCHWLTEEKTESFDADIREAGGLDFAVLGLGDNAHIGFNEPATQYDTRCRIQKLTNRTKAQYSWMFGTAEAVPEKACTLGIHSLCDAKKILVISLGGEKAQATFDMLYARDDSVIPAAFLQLPFDVTVYADTEAGKKL